MPALPDPDTWRGRRVVVTGHTGFKGAWLTLWLARMGARVTGLSGPPPTTPSLYADAHVGAACEREVTLDVRHEQAVCEAMDAARPEVVLHLAAQAIVRTSLADPLTTWAVNVVGTANVLRAVPHDVRAVVVVTSDKCYRDIETGRPMRENDPLGGQDPYSASKAAQELVAAAHRDTYDLPIATARAGNVIGGGDWAADRLVPDLMRAQRAAEPVVLRKPDAVRPWQHVLNPLSGYLVLAERLSHEDRFAGAYNFGPDLEDALPVREVVERLGVPSRVEPDPGAGRESTLLRLDSTKARRELGWAPTWDLERGLEATVRCYAGEESVVEQLEAFSG